MKPAFSIFVAGVVLLGSSSAEAARNSNLILPPPPLISTTPTQTNPIGGFGIGGFGTGSSFGALPGNPGSPTYDPNAALPSLGNSGSVLAPSAGTSSSGINTPSTNSGM